ncbi:TlpA disulfide reductase family protein [Porticoccaceae bacterium LTM1]|nr:TlpA disulfide reductase family protein [Porticoccaceae bacterium LTM1]
MKNVFIAIFALCFSTVSLSSDSQSYFATVTGNLLFETDGDVISLQKAENGKLKVVATSSVDEKGRFAFIVPIDEPGFYRIDYSGKWQNQLVRLYFNKRTKLAIDLYEDGYKLSGDNVALNEKVQEWNVFYNKLIPYTRPGVRVTYKDYFPFLKEEAIPTLHSFVKSLSTSDGYFNRLMKLSAETDLEWASYKFVNLPRSTHPTSEQYPSQYEDWVAEDKFKNIDYLKIDNAVDLMMQYFNREALKSGLPKLGERLSGPLQSVGADELKESYLQERLKSFLNRKPSEDAYFQMVDPIRKYMISDASQDLLLSLDKSYLAKVGSPWFNFNFESFGGENVTLPSLKGKIVYIDLWATWCGPCKAQIPYLQELEEEFHGRDIAFVSISSDKDREEWLEFVEEEELTGIQLIADEESWSKMAKLYDISGIPRFMILDKGGNIVDLDAPRPSDAELKLKLEGLLSQ